MGGVWIDFQKVKKAVNIRDVLDARGLPYRETPTGLAAKCPVHDGYNERQFRVAPSLQGFRCWSGSCSAQGNVLDLVAALDDVSVRDAAIGLARTFGVTAALEKPGTPSPSNAKKTARKGAPAGTSRHKKPRKKRGSR
ncbi:MAG: hypothetical protein GY937_12635 [bacterium]|nr:hypothetical protein [bacterium]